MTTTGTTMGGTSPRRQGGIVGVSGIFRPVNKHERKAMGCGIAARRAARIITIRDYMALGMKAAAISNRIGYTHISGLINWCKTNAPELREELRVCHSANRGCPISREQAVARLKILVQLKEIGVHPQSLASWAKNFPLQDYELALEDYAGDELELWGDTNYAAAHEP